jgi:putative nucleotidyltransferase with HDIG domain
MKQIIGFLINNLKRIGIFFLFLIAIAFIVWLLPKETRYKYEYQKGKPWLHETLISPFDFPIHKNEKELKHEKDSILLNSPPYFSQTEDVLQKQTEDFKINFNNVWDSVYKVDSTEILKLFAKTENSKDLIFSWCRSLLSDIYSNPGIIQFPDSLKELQQTALIIYVHRGNVEEEFQFNSFRNQSDAITYANKQVSTLIIDKFQGNSIIDKIFKELYFPKFIIPNTFFDSETSLLTRSQMVSGISLSRGMVQSGEKIISTGEIVTGEKYNILESLRNEYELTTYNPALIIGQTIAILVGMLMIVLFLLNFRKDILEHFTKTLFILTLIVFFIFLARFALTWNVLSIYLIPFTLLPIIIRAFYDSRLALFIHNVTMLMIGFFMPNSFEFVFLQIIAGMMAIFSLANVRRRGQLFMAAIFIFMAYSVVYFGIAVVQEGSFESMHWNNFAWFAGNGLMILAAYPLIFIFEKIFGFLSDVTLMELADTNQGLLRTLAEKAPGTFQHSMQVANLAEEVIFKIGGNSLLIRAGALYHDIGKMGLPHFYIENQGQGSNPHDEIDLEKSAEIITGHVPYGIETARKFRLPEPVIDFIRSHHGNTKVQYFYKTFIKNFPESKVDLYKFTYKGLPPTTKETAVLMMADAVEASARSLKVYTEQSINELVEKIISYQLEEKQFDNAAITLKEISEAKEIFKKKLKNIYHSRIEYPK